MTLKRDLLKTCPGPQYLTMSIVSASSGPLSPMATPVAYLLGSRCYAVVADGGLCIGNSQDSVRWMSSAAECSLRKDHAGLGRDPNASLRLYKNCSRVCRDFEMAFFQLDKMGHKIPSAFWFDAVLRFWMQSRAPAGREVER